MSLGSKGENGWQAGDGRTEVGLDDREVWGTERWPRGEQRDGIRGHRGGFGDRETEEQRETAMLRKEESNRPRMQPSSRSLEASEPSQTISRYLLTLAAQPAAEPLPCHPG